MKTKFSLSWTSVENWFSLGASVFVGGAAGYAEAHLTAAVSGAVPWRQVAIGSVLAGVIAVSHLAQVPSNNQASDTTDVN